MIVQSGRSGRRRRSILRQAVEEVGLGLGEPLVVLALHGQAEQARQVRSQFVHQSGGGRLGSGGGVGRRSLEVELAAEDGREYVEVLLGGGGRLAAATAATTRLEIQRGPRALSDAPDEGGHRGINR